MPTATASVPAAPRAPLKDARRRERSETGAAASFVAAAGAATAVNASAPLSSSITSVSLWSPPTASSRSTGLRPTNAAVKTGGEPHLPGRPHEQPYRREARECGEHLEGPEPAREAERRKHVAHEREERAVRGMLMRPADERIDRVRRGLREDVRVRIEAMDDAEAGEAEVTEDVLRDQRRP